MMQVKREKRKPSNTPNKVRMNTRGPGIIASQPGEREREREREGGEREGEGERESERESEREREREWLEHCVEYQENSSNLRSSEQHTCRRTTPQSAVHTLITP